MHPDQIVVLDVLRNGLCEETVGLGVCVPSRLVEGDLTGVIVEEGP